MSWEDEVRKAAEEQGYLKNDATIEVFLDGARWERELNQATILALQQQIEKLTLVPYNPNFIFDVVCPAKIRFTDSSGNDLTLQYVPKNEGEE